MPSKLHSTSLRIEQPLWNAIRFIAYLNKESCNKIITDILKEAIPSHLESLEYNLLEWNKPSNDPLKTQLKPEFDKHHHNLKNLTGEDEK